MSSVLGIEEERLNEMGYQISLILHKLKTPTRSGNIEFSSLDILSEFIALAETEKEQLFCAYMAGRWVEELFEN